MWRAVASSERVGMNVRLASMVGFSLMVALIVVLVSCSSKQQEAKVSSSVASSAEGIKPDLAEQEKRSQENVALLGGWTMQNLDWDRAQEDFTRLQELLLVQNPDFVLRSMTKVESQVVAGINIRLTCTGNQNGKTKKVLATFYHDLEGAVKLTELKFYDLES